MRLHLTHAFDMDPETYWRDLFFDPTFNERLYREGLGFESPEILEQTTGPDGTIRRRFRVRPSMADAPAAVRKLLGDRVSYIEEGVFDPKDQHWRTRMIPSVLADKFRAETDFWVEPAPGGRSIRHAVTDAEVRVFGLGSILEKFLEKKLRDSYGRAAAFTNAYARRK